MKRSITLLISNVLATLYAGYLIFAFGSAIAESGGEELLRSFGSVYSIVLSIAGNGGAFATFMAMLPALLCAHVILFAVGGLFGWLAFLCKKSAPAKLGAVLYLLGTICFPFLFFIGLPVTIVGFVGGGKQKKINKALAAAKEVKEFVTEEAAV